MSPKGRKVVLRKRDKVQTKSNLKKHFASAIKLQWQLTGWWSFLSPTIDVLRSLLSIGRAFIYAQIINLLTAFIASKIDSVFPLFWYYVLLLIVIEVLSPIINSVGIHYDNKLRLLSENKFDQIISKKISELDAEYFEDSKYQDLIYRVNRLNPGWILKNLGSILSETITFVIAAAAVLSLNWVIFILALIASVPKIFSAIISSKNWRELHKKLSNKKRFSWYLKYGLTEWDRIKELRPFNAINNFYKKLVKTQEEIVREELKQKRKYTILETITDIFGVITSVATRIWLFIKIISTKGVFGIGNYVFYDNLISKMESSSAAIVNNFGDVVDDMVNIEDYFILVNLKSKLEKPQKAKKIDTTTPPTIEFRNVSFTYPGKTKQVLTDVNFTLKANNKMAIIGVNGAGKTTLTKLLLRYYDPTKGDIFINGINLKQINIDDWYKTLAIIQQDFNNYPFQAVDNINLRIGTKTDPKKLRQAIKSAEAQFIWELPEKENTLLTRYFEDSVDLSGGQWQKIALARAFYKEAPLLIMDEPTSSIDARAEAEIFNNLWKMQKNKGAIVISHRFSTVRDADVILVLDKGKVIEKGTHNQLMQEKGIYHELFTKQAKSYK